MNQQLHSRIKIYPIPVHSKNKEFKNEVMQCTENVFCNPVGINNIKSTAVYILSIMTKGFSLLRLISRH